MRPVIGITCNLDNIENNYYLRNCYVISVQKAGGLPVVIPSMEDTAEINEYLDCCHGIILSGGGDIDPFYWGELPEWGIGSINPMRDAFELAIARAAMDKKIPLLGICRGCQVINVACGGSLIQDLSGDMSHQQNAPRNYPIHSISIKNNTLLSSITGNSRIRVNSFHHQAVKRPGHGLRICAYAPDGIIEAVERIDLPFCLGVQWHPESLNDYYSDNLFGAFVKCCN